MTPSRRMLITGAGRGLGLEFTRRWLERGDQVFGLARKPEESRELTSLGRDHAGRLHLHPCDVGDDASVEVAGKKVGTVWDGIDLVLNNAGTYGDRSQKLEDLDLDDVRRVFEVNTLGPIRVSRAFLPLLRRGKDPRLIHITSLMGSLEDNGSGGSWAYRISKTALNMACRNMAIQLQSDRIPCVVLHPGWVRTDMGGKGAPLGIEESVRSMMKTIDELTMDRTGGFLDRDGNSLPW